MSPLQKRNSAITLGPLGGLPGSGRNPKSLMFKNYAKAINLLDEHVEEALQVLFNGLKSTIMAKTGVEFDKENKIWKEKWEAIPDKWYRYNCATAILKKAIPDKKTKEITGEGGGKIKLEVTDKREAVLAIVNILDEIGLEELRQRAEDGSFKFFRDDRRPEIEAETEVERETTEEEAGSEPGDGEYSGESNEGPPVD